MECHIESSKCGCKGIRTCLICENVEGKLSKTVDIYQYPVLYTYCPHCNLCWPADKGQEPLVLSGVTLVLDFLNHEEEMEAINAIDKIPWMPSQSGRRKQDFGPKVNFKKKKGKIGDFKGFPQFTEGFVQKFQKHDALFDFYPVELCHLDYSPERGSAIEPHLDDAWIWGERLVTINLASSTTLTLTPANDQNCNCSNDSAIESIGHTASNGTLACSHFLPNLGSLKIQPNRTDNIISYPDKGSSPDIGDPCSSCRRKERSGKVAVQIQLPARSLLVLAGCARYNWYHEIKRCDIKSRRLAMTFRELSSNFLIDGSEKKLGDELLKIGRTYF